MTTRANWWRTEFASASVSFVCAALFSILSVLVITGKTASADHTLIVSLRALSSPLVTSVLLVVTFTSGKLALPVAILFTALLYRAAAPRTALFYAAACSSAQLLNAFFKHEIARARPHGVSPRLTAAGGYAYPSADVMMAVVIFALGAMLLSREVASFRMRVAVRVVAVVFVVAVAIARVYLGAHWPSDVLGGVLAGASASAFWVAALHAKDARLRRIPLTPIIER